MNLLRKLFYASIWAPGALDEEPKKYRNQKRVMFPAIDVLLFCGGISAAKNGIPAISEFYSDVVVDLFSYVLCAAAFICVIGLGFPKLYVLEVIGKGLLFGLLIGYTLAIMILHANGGESRGFVFWIAAVAMCPIIWKLSLLGYEWQARRNEEKAITKALDGGRSDG